MKSYIILVIFTIFFQITKPQNEQINIGVVGREWHILVQNKLSGKNNTLIEHIKTNSSLALYKQIQNCYNILSEKQINVIIGVSSFSIYQAAVQLNIPYFATISEESLENRSENKKTKNYYALKVPDIAYAKATLDLLSYFNVKKTVIIIDSSVDYKSFIQPFTEQKEIDIKLWNLADSDTKSIWRIESVLDNIINQSMWENYQNFVVKSEFELAKYLILRAKYYGMLVRPNKWYIISPVCHDISITAINQIFSNITFINEQCSDAYLRYHANDITNKTILNNAFQMIRSVEWNLDPDNLYKKFKEGEMKKFNEAGTLINFQFVFHTLNMDMNSPNILQYVGNWMSKDGVNRLLYNYDAREYIREKVIKNHMKIAAVEEHPHLIVKGNGTYIGFGVDLLNELSERMNFTYSINLKNSLGDLEGSIWTGVIGEVINGNADLTLGPLVQTSEKEDMLDFTTSFKQREISLVIRKPQPSTSLLQFITPFSYQVWLCCIGSVLVIMCTIWFIHHIHDKYFPDEAMSVKMNIKECSWFSFGAVLKKQLDVFPTCEPALIFHWSTYFFSVIIVSSFTANLAACITLKNYPLLVKSVSELANLPMESKISFGTVIDSDIFEFFRDSTFPDYKKIYQIMKNNPKWMVNNSSEGYLKAMNEQYVFIWDDSVNQYEIFSEPRYECQLMVVGRRFGKRSFSIGLRKNRKVLREIIDLHLLELLESGKMENYETKWWKSVSICSGNTPLKTKAMSIEEVGGVFLIVPTGITLSIILFIIKLIWFFSRKSIRKKKEKKKVGNNQTEIVLLRNGSNSNNNHGSGGNNQFLRETDLDEIVL